MPWSSSSPSAAVTTPQRLADGCATLDPPFIYLFPRRGRGCPRYFSCPQAGSAGARCRRGCLRCRCVGIWTGLDTAGFSPALLVKPTCFSKSREGEDNYVEDEQKLSAEATGAEGMVGNGSAKGTFSSKELMKQLKRYGVAGVLSYGLLNTFYYLITFLLVWFYFAPAPGKMGYVAAVERFLKVMAAVWAGSQVTKLLRAGGALALAPLVDRGLSWFTVKFKFESKGKAFAAIAGACFGLAFLLFLMLTLLWA